ncbi:MAG TPA: host attachment protein [Rhodanobacteraceae bacterium]|jgi:protein required for attachment to host cells
MQPTWILVADRARARILEISDEEPLAEIACFANLESRARARDTTTHRLPRVNESASAARHAIEPHTPLREKASQRFARLLGDALERGRDEHRYERLVLVAPPRFLGSLHEALDDPLRECVVEEIGHDLTMLPIHALRERLPPAVLR